MAPFFRLASNQLPLTKQLFVSKVRQALRELGLPEHHFAGHSFRIGFFRNAIFLQDWIGFRFLLQRQQELELKIQ